MDLGTQNALDSINRRLNLMEGNKATNYTINSLPTTSNNKEVRDKNEVNINVNTLLNEDKVNEVIEEVGSINLALDGINRRISEVLKRIEDSNVVVGYIGTIITNKKINTNRYRWSLFIKVLIILTQIFLICTHYGLF